MRVLGGTLLAPSGARARTTLAQRHTKLPIVSTQTTTFGRIFGRADGRDRIAVPFWNGILSALGAIAILVACGFVAAVVLMVVIVLSTGHLPSLNPGHPLIASTLIGSYLGGGAFAWMRLRRLGALRFHHLSGGDVRAILIAVLVLIVVRIGTVFQLVATHQTKHVQAGFEHFTVIGRLPHVTTISVVLLAISTVIVAPIAEEMLFRGLLFGALAPRLGVLAAAVISALLFGAAHGDAVLFPTLAALGFVNAIAYAATGNLWVPIAVHAINNAVSTAFLVTASLQGS